MSDELKALTGPLNELAIVCEALARDMRATKVLIDAEADETKILPHVMHMAASLTRLQNWNAEIDNAVELVAAQRARAGATTQ